MSHGRRMRDQALHAAERLGQREAFESREKRLDRGLAAGELEAQHGAEAALLAARNLVARMIGQARVVHALAPPAGGVSSSTTAAVFSACTRMRACSVRTPRSVMKLSNGAPVTPRRSPTRRDSRAAPRGGDDRAADHVAVAVQVLGGRMHDEVRAERQRLLPERREEGVVDHHQRAGRVRGLGDRAISMIRSSGLLGVSIQTRLPAWRRAPSQRGGIALIDELDHRACPAHASAASSR